MMSDTEVSICKNCSKQIKWDDSFSWYHGEFGGGWNTTCEDGENRAEPISGPNVSKELKEKLADLFMKWSRLDSTWEDVYDDRDSALTIVERIIREGWTPEDSEQTNVWVIVYYATGMTPLKEYFMTEEAALATWDDWVDDPYKGAFSLKKETTIRRKLKGK